MAEIDTSDMTEPGATRYRVMVQEKQRVEAEAAEVRGRLLVAEAEIAVLRRALGLHAATPGAKKPGTMA